MAVTFHTLTGDVTDILGVDFPLDRVTGATLETNLARDHALVAGSSVRLPGVGKVDVQADGTFSVANLVASDSADTNIDPETPLLYRVNIRYRHPQAQRARNVVDVPVWQSPWFELNGSGTTTLANVIEVAYLPASLVSQATATLEAARDDAVADVQAATTGAVTARNEAEGFADDAAASAAAADALVISDLGTTDGQTRALIESPSSQTRAALAAQTGAAIAVAKGGRNTVVLIGPSLEEQNGQGSDTLDASGGAALRARGWFHWCNGFLAAQGKALKLLRNSGVGGDTWQGMAARFTTDVIAYAPDVVVIGSPTNDFGAANHTVAQVQAWGIEMIEAARAIGARVVVHTVPPRSTFTTLAQKAKQYEINRWIGDLPFLYRNVAAVDTWTPLADTATGAPAYGTTLDGTHYSISGAARIGKATADALAPLIPLSRPPLTSFAADPRRFTDNPTFLTSGSGWAVISATATSVAYPAADRGYGNKAVVTITGNTATTSIRGITRTQPISAFSVQSGDILQQSCRVKWASLVALGGSTPCAPVMRFEQLDAGGAVLRTAYSLYSASSEWELTYPSTSNSSPWPMLPAGEMVLTTFPTTVHASCTQVRTYLGWIGAASATLEFSDLAPLKDAAATAARPSPTPAGTSRASLGVDDYSMRWLANELVGSDGSTVTGWTDPQSGQALAHSVDGNRPTLQTVGGEKVLRFDGVDDYLFNNATPAYNSVAVLCRVLADAPASDQGVFSSGSSGGTGATHVGMTRRNASGLAGSFFTNSRTSTADAGGAGSWPLGTWFVLLIRHNDVDARTQRGNTLAATSTASAGGVTTATALEVGRRTTSYGRIELAEIACYPDGLTDAEMTTVAAAMQANHPGLFA